MGDDVLMSKKTFQLIALMIMMICILSVSPAGCSESDHSVTLPKDAKERDDYLPLMEDTSIENIYVEDGNEFFRSIDGVLFTKDGKELLLYPAGRHEESYSVPEGTERIDDDCSFGYGCALKTLELPASLQSFCSENLHRTEIERYVADPASPVFCDVDGVLFSKDLKTLVAYPPGRQENEYAVPDGTEVIGIGAFYENKYVINILLPESIHTIGIDAFYMSYIESINLPKKMRSIGWSAFKDCYSLVFSDLHLPEGLTEIEAMSFETCQLLGTLHIPEGVTLIDQEALCFQAKLTDIYWPDSLNCFVDEAFMKEWVWDKLEMVFGWNDTGIADYTCVMHAHEGTPVSEWIKNYPHIVAPQGVDTMDVNGYRAVCDRAMQEAGYKDAAVCYNPEEKWMAVKPLVAYNLHQAAAVYQYQGKTILCGFDDLDGCWKLKWVNEAFLDDGNLPVLFAFYGEDSLRIILPDATFPDLLNAIDYRFDAKTLKLSSALYVKDYLWYEYYDLWQCRLQDNTLIYAYPDEWDYGDEGKQLEEKGEDFASVEVESGTVYLPTAVRLPFPPGVDFEYVTEEETIIP